MQKRHRHAGGPAEKFVIERDHLGDHASGKGHFVPITDRQKRIETFCALWGLALCLFAVGFSAWMAMIGAPVVSHVASAIAAAIGQRLLKPWLGSPDWTLEMPGIKLRSRDSNDKD